MLLPDATTDIRCGRLTATPELTTTPVPWCHHCRFAQRRRCLLLPSSLSLQVNEADGGDGGCARARVCVCAWGGEGGDSSTTGKQRPSPGQ